MKNRRRYTRAQVEEVEGFFARNVLAAADGERCFAVDLFHSRGFAVVWNGTTAETVSTLAAFDAASARALRASRS